MESRADVPETLPFIVAKHPASANTMGVFPRPEREIMFAAVRVSELSENIRAAVATLASVFDEAAREAGRLRLREVQIGLEVTASGGVRLVGTSEVGATGAITLTFSE